MNKRAVVLVATALCIPIAAVGFVLYANAPSKGSVKKSSSDLNVVKGDSTTLKTFASSYFTMTLPDSLHQKSSQETNGQGIYGQYLYVDSSFGASSQLGVTLGHLNGLSLEEIPFVRQRALSADNYTQAARSSSSIIFTSTGGDEYAIITLHGNDYIAIVSSGRSDESGSIQDIAEQASRSLQWR